MEEGIERYRGLYNLFYQSFQGTHGREPTGEQAIEGTEYMILHKEVFKKGSRGAWVSYHRWIGLPLDE